MIEETNFKGHFLYKISEEAVFLHLIVEETCPAPLKLKS